MGVAAEGAGEGGGEESLRGEGCCFGGGVIEEEGKKERTESAYGGRAG